MSSPRRERREGRWAQFHRIVRARVHRFARPGPGRWTLVRRLPRPYRGSVTWPRIARPTTGPRRRAPYRRAWLLGDVLAGLTVVAYLVPQVMAYAQIAGLPAVAGLWAALGPLAVYAALGSSRQLSVGPESTTALMTAAALLPLAAGDPQRYAALAAALALLVGLACLLARLVRLGFLADLLSKPVLTGYLAGVALTIVAGQLGTVTGVPVADTDPAGQVTAFIRHLPDIHWPTTVFSLVLAVALFTLHRLLPRVPGPLVVVTVAATAVAAFSLQDKGIAVIGTVPDGLPVPALPAVTWTQLTSLAIPALGVAFVGYTDTVLTARAFAFRQGHDRIDANREWLALGAANLSAGLLRGFPVSSSGSRTAIAVAAGARTQVCSLVALAVLVLTLVVAGPALSTLPRAALGALVVYAAVRMINIVELRRIARFRRSEVIIALLTTIAVVGLGVGTGILVAVALSVADLLQRVARPHDGILGFVPGLAGMHDVADYPVSRRIPGLVVYRYDAPLCFANADDFRHRAVAAATAGTSTSEGPDGPQRPGWFVLDAEAVVGIDLTAADALVDVIDELQRAGTTVALARVKQELLPDLRAAGVVDRVGADRLYPTLPTAVDAYRRWDRSRPGRIPDGTPPPRTPGTSAALPLSQPDPDQADHHLR